MLEKGNRGSRGNAYKQNLSCSLRRLIFIGFGRSTNKGFLPQSGTTQITNSFK